MNSFQEEIKYIHLLNEFSKINEKHNNCFQSHHISYKYLSFKFYFSLHVFILFWVQCSDGGTDLKNMAMWWSVL